MSDLLPTLTAQALLEKMDVYHPKGIAGFKTLDQILDEFAGEHQDKIDLVITWRDRLPWFRQEMEIKETNHIGRPHGNRTDVASLYDFLDHFRETGLRIESARRAGITWTTVKSRLNPSSRMYNADFKYAFDAICDERKANWLDIVEKKATEGDGAHVGDLNATKFLINRDDKIKGKTEKTSEGKLPSRPINVLIQNINDSVGLSGEVVEAELR